MGDGSVLRSSVKREALLSVPGGGFRTRPGHRPQDLHPVLATEHSRTPYVLQPRNVTERTNERQPTTVTIPRGEGLLVANQLRPAVPAEAQCAHLGPIS